MMVFFLAAFLMIAVLLLIIIIPLLSKSENKDRSEQSVPQFNISIYRDQFKELENELARGAITQQEYDEGRTELERRVLEESVPEENNYAPSSKAGVYTAILLVLIVPLFSALLWILTQPLGDFRLDGGKYEGVYDYTTGQTVQRAGEMHDMEKAVANLREHLRANPSDLQGWVMLGRTMLTTRRYPEAVEAYEKAYALAPGNPTVMVDLADAIAMVQGQDLAGKPWELVKRALQEDPTNWKALMMAGTDYFNRKDYRMAVMYWERLLKTLSPNDGLVDGVKASIREARDLGQIVGPVPDTLDFGKKEQSEEKTAPMMSMMQKREASAAQAPQVNQSEAVTHVIEGTVELSDALKEKAKAFDTLYITARPAQGGRMPIVQTQIRVLDFPVHFKLDNTMKPRVDMGGGLLSEHSTVRITARLGKAGSIMPQPGDLDGAAAEPVANSAEGVKVVIDKVNGQ